MWWIRGGIDPERFGGGRTVLHVRMPDARRTRFWFVVTPADVSLCFTDPGFDVDVTVEASLGVLYQIWVGVIALRAAVRDGLVTLSGRHEAVRRLPDALLLSPVAPYVGAGAPRTGSPRPGSERLRGRTPAPALPGVWHTSLRDRPDRPALPRWPLSGVLSLLPADTPGPVHLRRRRGPHESAITT